MQACGKRQAVFSVGGTMSFDLIFGAIVAFVVLAYLLAVLAQPERY